MNKFVRLSRVFFGVAAFTYLAHFFVFDIPNNLQPIYMWLIFRLVAAGICFACIAYYSTSFVNTSYYRAPAILVMGLACLAQSCVTYFYPDAPWIYPFAFIFGSVLVLQMSPLSSLLFAVPLSILCCFPLLAAGIEISSLVSASIVFCLASAVTRTAYMFEIQAFLRENERDESRREIIKLGKDFEARLKSFIPRVISDRIEAKIEHENMSPLNATIAVLKPKKQQVACLFSDIRGFTQGSREIDSFLAESVIPEVKACSDAVENQHGIPRKIGDLIFAYFDDAESRINVVRATLAGLRLSELNQDLNATTSTVEVRRFILISSGEALVGNVGGLNSAVEITALGSPVNFLSRLDDATKIAGLAKHLAPGDLVLSKDAALVLESLNVGVNLQSVDLRMEDVEIRDFPEVEDLYILKPLRQKNGLISKLFSVAGDEFVPPLGVS